MSYSELVGDDEIVGDDDFDFAGDDDDLDVGDDPDVDALLSGDDDDDFAGEDIIGAAKAFKMGKLTKELARAALRKAKQKKAMARLALRRNNVLGVRRRQLANKGKIPLGFKQLAVAAAGGQATIVLQPAVLFKPKRLLIPSTLASAFELTSFLIGQRSCLMNGAPIPAEAFQETSVNQGWDLPTVQISQPMTMIWTNVSGAAADLRGVWHGDYVD